MRNSLSYAAVLLVTTPYRRRLSGVATPRLIVRSASFYRCVIRRWSGRKEKKTRTYRERDEKWVIEADVHMSIALYSIKINLERFDVGDYSNLF